MHDILKQFKKVTREVRLTPDEKAAMRTTLVRFMAAYPAVHSTVKPGVLSPYALLGRMRNFKTLSLVSLGGLVLGGSVAFAAEGTLPGDLLYPVKTEINERVRGMAALTPQAKAAWEVRQVERRLEEIEKLAARSEVSPAAKELAQNNLERYAERVKDRVASFEDRKDVDGATATTEQFAKVLRAHEAAAEHLRKKMITPNSLPSMETSSALPDEAALRAQEIIDAKEQEGEKGDRLAPQRQGEFERLEKSKEERNGNGLW